jgi:hypothetical protein
MAGFAPLLCGAPAVRTARDAGCRGTPVESRPGALPTPGPGKHPLAQDRPDAQLPEPHLPRLAPKMCIGTRSRPVFPQAAPAVYAFLTTRPNRPPHSAKATLHRLDLSTYAPGIHSRPEVHAPSRIKPAPLPHAPSPTPARAHPAPPCVCYGPGDHQRIPAAGAASGHCLGGPTSTETHPGGRLLVAAAAAAPGPAPLRPTGRAVGRRASRRRPRRQPGRPGVRHRRRGRRLRRIPGQPQRDLRRPRQRPAQHLRAGRPGGSHRATGGPRCRPRPPRGRPSRLPGRRVPALGPAPGRGVPRSARAGQRGPRAAAAVAELRRRRVP